MLKVTRRQRGQMLQADLALLRAALLNLVRQEYPDIVRGVPDDLQQRMVEHASGSALDLGFTEPRHVGAFTMLMFEFGPHFHRHHAVRDRLTDRSRSPAERLAAVCRETPESAWREIAATLHRATWFPGLQAG